CRGSAGRADQRDRLRRPPLEPGAAGIRGARLGARRARGRGDGVGNHGSGHRRGWRDAPRPDGDEAVLRLQLRRLFRPLAVVRQAGREAAEGLPRQLVPQGCRRPLHVAGFGDNMRVLEWIIGRVDGGAKADAAVIGHVPAEGALDLDGADVPADAMAELLRVDEAGWKAEAASVASYLDELGVPGDSPLRAALGPLEGVATGS